MMMAGIDFFLAKIEDGKPNLSWQLVFDYLAEEIDSREQLRWLAKEAIKTGARDVAALHKLTLAWRATNAQRAAAEEYDQKVLEWKRELLELGERRQTPLMLSGADYDLPS